LTYKQPKQTDFKHNRWWTSSTRRLPTTFSSYLSVSHPGWQALAVQRNTLFTTVEKKSLLNEDW